MTRNGSDQTLKQQVWGVSYVDELVQVSLNQDPFNADSGTYTENVCERSYWAMQDVNFNVLGLVSRAGRLQAGRHGVSPALSTACRFAGLNSRVAEISHTIRRSPESGYDYGSLLPFVWPLVTQSECAACRVLRLVKFRQCRAGGLAMGNEVPAILPRGGRRANTLIPRRPLQHR